MKRIDVFPSVLHPLPKCCHRRCICIIIFIIQCKMNESIQGSEKRIRRRRSLHESMTEVFVGTSGWSYDWNLGNSLDWYVKESRLNTIELNMSFYRFPYPNMVKSWATKGKQLAWVVKVHRSITHFQKLSKLSVESFQRFKKLFAPLEDLIHYYLFQLPPSFTDINALEQFIDKTGGGKTRGRIPSSHPVYQRTHRMGEKARYSPCQYRCTTTPQNHHEPDCCLRTNPWPDRVVLPQLFRP